LNITKDQLKLENIPFINDSTKFVLLPPYKNQSSRDGTSTNVIALVREINGTFFGFKKVGTVMVLQDYQLIEQICATASPDIQVIVLNQQSDVIYPFNKLAKTEAKLYTDQFREAEAGKIHSDTSSVVNEIELLHRAFMKMFTRINNATNEIIQARSSEAEAHFLALQAQMNPHFLYNSLMCISAAGQEIGSQKIKLMCAQLSDLLRYVTSIDNNAIKIRDELNHAELYLQFIKWRYEERFDYSIHVDERILDLHVPKLIIQPLLENCLNHGLMKIRAPWRVEVSGIFLSDHHWVLEIKDNGNGFQDDELELIRERLLSVDRSLSEGKLDNRLEVGGMGLMNIYTRMKLIYKETAVFELYNHAAGGAVVKIGNEEEITK
ncbi:sensor histidine kinase, partial [Paenibacillus sp. TAF58]